MVNQTSSSTSSSTCAICSQLPDSAAAYQKYGWEEENTYLPAVANKLVVVRDLKPYGSRKLQLQQCPECGTYYLYKTDYEYLVNGTEDEEYLDRLAASDVANYLVH